jgi:hypothetical protein
MKTKPIFKTPSSPSYKGYDREVYLSEYVRLHREHYRRLTFCAVVSVGINVFLLLVMVMR